VVFVANTDFVKDSSFTVSVTEARPTIKQSRNVLPLWKDTLYLQGTPGETISTSLTLTNKFLSSQGMEYTIYPIGHQVSSGISTASVRQPISTDTGSASNNIFDASLFQTKTGLLKNTSDLNTSHGASEASIPIQARCPTEPLRYGGFFKTGIDVVYSTGAIDDYGTPNDPSDDRPELDVLAVKIKLLCGNPMLVKSSVYCDRDLDALYALQPINGFFLSNNETSVAEYRSSASVDLSDPNLYPAPPSTIRLEPGETLELSFGQFFDASSNSSYFDQVIAKHATITLTGVAGTAASGKTLVYSLPVDCFVLYY
jgi:hypothetical protein